MREGKNADRSAAEPASETLVTGSRERRWAPAPDPVRTALLDELPALWRFACRLTRHGEDAEDLVRRTCSLALENGGRYRERERPTSWLFRLCHDVWRNELRAATVRRAGRFGGAADGYAAGRCAPPRTREAQTCGSSPALAAAVEPTGVAAARDPDTAGRAARLDEVFVAVEALPDALREVVLLVSVEGFGYREAAEILEVSLATVTSRLVRARLTLDRRLRPARVGRGRRRAGSRPAPHAGVRAPAIARSTR